MKQLWWHRCAELSVMTGCCCASLLVLANNPSADEIYKGLASGVAAFFISQFTSGLYAGKKT